MDLICVHDAARPLVGEKEARKAFARATVVEAVALAVRVKPTIKRCDAEGRVEETLQRDALWEVQTPQVVRTELLKKAYAHSVKNNITVTDDLALVEALGHPVYLVEGDYRNIKITTKEDLDLAERWVLRS
jgi:2-C-methyl-D-erythritol 4-phosphate cytidylyltransferase